MSVRLSADLPFACSGAMYATVPSSTPAPVINQATLSSATSIANFSKPELHFIAQ